MGPCYPKGGRRTIYLMVRVATPRSLKGADVDAPPSVSIDLREVTPEIDKVRLALESDADANPGPSSLGTGLGAEDTRGMKTMDPSH